MKEISIIRQGSLLYARAYRRMVLVAVILYFVAGFALSVTALVLIKRVLPAVAILTAVAVIDLGFLLMYKATLWVLERESRQSVDITNEGFREKFEGRERAFIPWDGVKEVELAGTIIAGASLRVKGNFSRITISNVDLVLHRRMTIREMHRALSQTETLLDILTHTMQKAPAAELKMNRLARRRLNKNRLNHTGLDSAVR